MTNKAMAAKPLTDTPPLPPSFVDQISIQHEPRGELGRYLLAAERLLEERRMRAYFISPTELVKLNQRHQASWFKLMPLLDCRINRIAIEDFYTLAVTDQMGEIAASVSVRRFDIAADVKDEFESLRLFYGQKAQSMAASVEFQLDVPSASRLSGNVFYLGGVWVRPDARYAALTGIITRIARYTALAAWNPDYEIALGTDKFLRADVMATYAYHHTERAFTYRQDGQVLWTGVFLWSDREANLANLRHDLAELNANDTYATDAVSTNFSSPRANGMRRRV